MHDDTGKQCGKCAAWKPLTAFSPHPTGRDGYRNICKACRVIAQRKYVEYRQARWRGLQDKVFDHYGRACACCGTTDDLSVDHVNGNGNAHRMELFRKKNASGTRFYLWLIREGFPDGFQVLCLPCNQSKGSGPACLLHNPRPHCPSCSCYSS